MTNMTPAKTAFSRVFIIQGRAGPAHAPVYHSCLKAAGLDWSFGDVEPIECPDPSKFGEFVEVGEIRGAKERASSSLTGRYAADLESTLLTLARFRCAVDVQVNFGACTDARIPNTFTKKFVWEDVSLGSYSTEDLGALSSDENAAVNESTDLSIEDAYEVLQLTFQQRAPDLVANEVNDIVICDQVSCGECEEPSWGCEKIYALQGGIIGSPGTPPDVLYSIDKGVNWALDQINSMMANESADGIACLLDYVFVVSNDSCSLHWKEKADINAGVADIWAEVTTGFVAGNCPNDVWSVGTGAFIVGDNGYVYYTSDPTAGVSVLDAGVAETDNLNAVHALDEEHAVAVGNNDAVIHTVNGTNWAAPPTTPGSGANLLCVWMRSEDEWWVGTSNGRLYYTTGAGAAWTQKTLPGTAITAIYDIQFATPSVGYCCGVANGAGAMWRTYDGGYSWVRLPEGAGNLPTSVQLSALAACADDVNFVVAGGLLNAHPGDGVLIIGQD